VVIFDCNGVLVDGEQISAAVAAEEFTRAGFPMTPGLVARFFTGRRAADMLADVETDELRPTPHAAYALTWLRGPKCVASSTALDRIRVSLETAGLLRFFEPNLFSAHDVPRGKPAPDLFLHVADKMGIQASDCIVVEDSPVGVAAAVAAGMTPIGFVGGSHVHPQLPAQLAAAGASVVIADMRVLKSTVVALRGW
jgi:HAD superfamily hydrolase (TIGR01509 family)